jgi:hypothetical protein
VTRERSTIPYQHAARKPDDATIRIMPPSRKPPRSREAQASAPPPVGATAPIGTPVGTPFQASARLQMPERYTDTALAYSNVTVVSFTPNDVTVHFSQYTLPVPTTPPVADLVFDVPVSPVISVAMPPEVARTLIAQLQAQLDSMARIKGLPPTPAA